MTICKSANFSADSLKNSQKHILNPVYKSKVREIINNAVGRGDDISLDEEGNILCLQTKFYVRKYEWNSKIQDFVKVSTKSKKKSKNDEKRIMGNNLKKEMIGEFITG
ncbi:MAG: hypothetical protein HRK26_05180 [Rickettsiaceae bacterium H1]|nr:hypothetical protein [Rickettsiaceae bacterium H1]